MSPPDALSLDRIAHEGADVRPFVSAHLRAALQAIPVGLLTFDRHLGVLFANDRLSTTLGIQPAILQRARVLLDLLGASTLLDDVAAQQLHETCIATVGSTVPIQATVSVCPKQSSRVFTMQVVPLDDGGWMALFEDVTTRQAAETSALELAMCDPLTGLPNRRLFEKHLVESLEKTASQPNRSEAEPDTFGPAVMLVDLDRFKAVNDTLGHSIGDALLRLVSKRLRSTLRSEDTVARLGGDEFALIVSSMAEQRNLGQLARRVVDVLGRPYLINGHLVNVGASIGIALAPRDGCEHGHLLRNADLALYHAKAIGRNTFSFFAPEMDARALARRSLEIDLRKALALREFELHYQPQIDLDSNAVVGFEALLRWRHPERGLVSPADFIPLAEEIGLIVPLGEWVLREACSEAAGWPDDVSIAVNVSPYQFEDTTKLVNAVTRCLSLSGLSGKRLEIEITESVLLRNEAAVLASLHQLRAMGVRVAMDDFGTGYSSLSQLHSFPFDKIKIDRSFVKDHGDVAGQNAIIRAITSLGMSLGMATIAEGVETPEQLSRIREEGCHSVQGYLFSRPVPVDQVQQFIAEFGSRHSPASPSAARSAVE